MTWNGNSVHKVVAELVTNDDDNDNDDDDYDDNDPSPLSTPWFTSQFDCDVVDPSLVCTIIVNCPE